ncbi:MAG: hypothetical protein K5905_04325 [Roseibium sp.]|uniref:hypothetical protein n=1 Tax=Roseibium sp. TaxID=1936156 RepID=UPI00260E59FC|nr:hypothetical protein [Roseibium sp.]MCV0424676.1 hypothetical protein [Roseibium sp.]
MGIRTSNIAQTAAISELIGHVEVDGEKSTAVIPFDNLAAQVEAKRGPSYSTLAELQADLAWVEGTEARVWGDATLDNLGIYKKSGVPDAGAWTRIGPLPETDVSRSLRVPDDETIEPFPDAATRAGTVPMFDELGNPTTGPTAAEIAAAEAHAQAAAASAAEVQGSVDVTRNTVAALKAMTDAELASYTKVRVQGVNNIFDGGFGFFRVVAVNTYDLSGGDIDGLCFANTEGGYQFIRLGYEPDLDIQGEWLALDRTGATGVIAKIEALIAFADNNGAFAEYYQSGVRLYLQPGQYLAEKSFEYVVGDHEGNGFGIVGQDNQTTEFLFGGNFPIFKASGTKDNIPNGIGIENIGFRGDGASQFLAFTPTAGASDTFTCSGVNVADDTKLGEVVVMITTDPLGTPTSFMVPYLGANSKVAYANNGSDLDVTVTYAFDGTEQVDIAVFPVTRSQQIAIQWEFVNKGRIKNVRFTGCRVGAQIDKAWQTYVDEFHASGGGNGLPGSDTNWIPLLQLRSDGDGLGGPGNALVIDRVYVTHAAYAGWRALSFHGTKIDNFEIGASGRNAWWGEPEELPPGITDPGDNTNDIFEFGHLGKVVLDAGRHEDLRFVNGTYTESRLVDVSQLWLGSGGRLANDNALFVEGVHQVCMPLIKCDNARGNALVFKDCYKVYAAGVIEEYGFDGNGGSAIINDGCDRCHFVFIVDSTKNNREYAYQDLNSPTNCKVDLVTNEPIDNPSTVVRTQKNTLGVDANGRLAFLQANVRRLLMDSTALFPATNQGLSIGAATSAFNGIYASFVTATTAALEDKDHPINTMDAKVQGLPLLNTDTNKLVVANGSSDTDQWRFPDGTTAHVPIEVP